MVYFLYRDYNRAGWGKTGILYTTPEARIWGLRGGVGVWYSVQDGEVGSGIRVKRFKMKALAVLFVIGFTFGILAFWAWLLMLVMGALHHVDGLEAIPAIGFWPSFLIVVALGVVGRILGIGNGK